MTNPTRQQIVSLVVFVIVFLFSTLVGMSMDSIPREVVNALSVSIAYVVGVLTDKAQLEE